MSVTLGQLHKRSPHCHWCGELTVRHIPAKGVKPPGNSATRDHLITRRLAGELLGQIHRPFVLACARCNHGRNDIDQALMAGQDVSQWPQFLVDSVIAHNKLPDKLDPHLPIPKRFRVKSRNLARPTSRSWPL